MIDQSPLREARDESGAEPEASKAGASLGIREALAALRRYARSRHDASLKKARELLARGRSPEQALEFLAHSLMNKLLHAPSANIRAAALRGDERLLRQAEQLFEAGERKGSG